MKLTESDERMPELAGMGEITPPPSLVARVMREIAEPAPFHLWNWLRGRKRFEISLSPLGAAAGALALGLMVTMASWPDRDPARAPRGEVVANDPRKADATGNHTVLVRFMLTARGAQRVALVGDFNGWDPEDTTLTPADGDGIFVATVPLRGGSTHEYMFVVDGQWMADPASEHRQPDGFGRQNSVLRL